MNIGRKIRAVREGLGMPRAVLARRVGVAENTIWRIEAGRRTPSMGLLEKIARALRTEPAELLREPEFAGKAEAPRGAGQPEITEKARNRAQEWAAEMGARLHGMSDEVWSTYVRGLDTEDEIVQAYRRFFIDERKMLQTAWHMDKAFRPQQRARRRELSEGLRELRMYRLGDLRTAAMLKHAEEIVNEISEAMEKEAVQ